MIVLVGIRRKNDKTEEGVAGALSQSRREGTGCSRTQLVLGLALGAGGHPGIGGKGGHVGAGDAEWADAGWHGRSSLPRASAFPGKDGGQVWAGWQASVEFSSSLVDGGSVRSGRVMVPLYRNEAPRFSELPRFSQSQDSD